VPEDNPFDFYKAFFGIDIAKAEQIAEIVGRATAALYKGMRSAGLNDRTARLIISDAEKAILVSILTSNREAKEDDDPSTSGS
jgi:hypothetical protein